MADVFVERSTVPFRLFMRIVHELALFNLG